MIDSHCHLNFENIANNLDQIIENAKKNNIKSILSINTDPNKFQDHLKLIKKYPGIYLSYGLHPCEINESNLSNLNFNVHCHNPFVVGIGETGIDLYHSQNNLSQQIKIFRDHIDASLKYDLPLIIHQRNSENEIISLLKEYSNNKLKIVFHCFAGSKKLLDFCLQNNYYISLSGIITFNNAEKLRNTIKNYPLDLILIETDSPFLAPVPMRGKVNEPSYIMYIAEYLSKFYNLQLSEFEEITDKNFFKLFNKTKKDNLLK